MIVVDLVRTDDAGSRRVGTISWDGKRLTASPPDGKEVREIMALPVMSSPGPDAPSDAPPLVYSARKSPEQWLRKLPDYFRGSRFCAVLRD